MEASILPLILACAFAAVLGFTAHRASVCTVRAAAELLSTQTIFMMASIAKSALWVLLLGLPFLIWAPPYLLYGWPLTATAIAAGFLFGIGAAVNGGCAYSTMTRMVDGEGRMIVSVIGFALGIVGFQALVGHGLLDRPEPTAIRPGLLYEYALPLLAVLLLWAAFEIYRLWIARPKDRPLRDLVSAPNYRLSAAALVIGVSATAIFLLIGSPGYTVTVQNLVESALGSGAPTPAAQWILLLAVLAGMAVSTWQRGSFRVDWRPGWEWLRNLAGGAMMGLGTALLPGGNDALILYGIPTFSPHAIPAYAALVVGAIAGLATMARFGIEVRVSCRNDFYIAQYQPPGSILNGHAPAPGLPGSGS